MEQKRVFVGNLPFAVSEKALENHFNQAGTVKGIKIIRDRETGRSKGFGFVELDSTEQAHRAVSDLNGSELEGRAIRVSIAEEKESSARKTRGHRGGPPRH